MVSLPHLKVLACLILVLCSSSNVASAPLALFEQGELGAWKPQIFEGETQYELSDQGLLASAKASASGLVLEQELQVTPSSVLQWQWKLLQGFSNEDEKTKKGDDFALRLYVVDKHWIAWKSRTLVYVWSQQYAKESVWDNPYTSQAKMLVVNSVDDPVGEWMQVERRVLDDWYRLFGDRPDQLEAIAIMSDTDGSGAEAQAVYGNIELIDKH